MQRDRGPECRSLANHRIDLQIRLMTVEDVLDDREPQSRAAGIAAVGCVHAVEPLGQARQVLGRDPWSVVRYRNRDMPAADWDCGQYHCAPRRGRPYGRT